MLKEIEEQTPIYKLDIWYDKGRYGASGIIDGVFRNDTLDALFEEEHVKELTELMDSFVKQDLLMGVPTKPIANSDIDRTLLDRLIERLKKEVYFAKEEDYIVWALWIAQTWLVDLRLEKERIDYIFDGLVRMCIRAPIGHGKSVALDTLRRYSRKCIKADGITSAVAFRMADRYGATLVLDEYQETIRKEPELELFVRRGYNHDKKYLRAHKEDKGTYAYHASVPVAYSMKTSRSSEDSESRCLEFIIPKAPPTFEPLLVRSKFTQELYELRVWAQQPDNLDKLIQIKETIKPYLLKKEIHNRPKDNVIGLCVIARLFGKEEWFEAIIKRSKESTKTLEENLAVSIDGFILDAIDILTYCKPFESNYPVLLSAMRELAINNHQELNADDYTIEKIRKEKACLIRSVKNYGFITKESRYGTKRDYRIDFSEKASRDAYNKLRKAVRGESEPLVQSKLEIAVNHPSEHYGLTDGEFEELERMLTEAKVSDNAVRKQFPNIELHRLVQDGIVKIDELGIVHLKPNIPKGKTLELADCM